MKKVVLLTGASSGIGKETARQLAQRGYAVYGAARRIESLKDLEPIGVQPLQLDISNDDSIVNAVQHILHTEGRIDVLINNAGFGAYGAVEDMKLDDARYQFEVNVFGLGRLIQLVLPKMRENRFGKIVNITSGGGKLATPYGGWYHASKFAVEGLSDSLRNEVKQFGIDVIVIEPGSIESEFAGVAMENLEKNSRNSAYSDSISRITVAFKKIAKFTSKPIVISELIIEAIESRNPKIRYAGGAGIKPTLFLRWLLSDRMFDRMLQSQMKY